MSTQEASPGFLPFVFSSPEEFSLCQHILKEYLPYDPHDFQIEGPGVCKLIDGIDLLAILATGTGKPGFIGGTYLPLYPVHGIL